MALIYCPECGSRISDKALMCIHCGCPAEYYSKEKPIPLKAAKPVKEKDAEPKTRTIERDGERIPVVKGMKEAARLTGISYHQLRHWVLNDEIVYLKTGNKILINMDRLSDFVNGIPIQGGDALKRKSSV